MRLRLERPWELGQQVENGGFGSISEATSSATPLHASSVDISGVFFWRFAEGRFDEKPSVHLGPPQATRECAGDAVAERPRRGEPPKAANNPEIFGHILFGPFGRHGLHFLRTELLFPEQQEPLLKPNV